MPLVFRVGGDVLEKGTADRVLAAIFAGQSPGSSSRDCVSRLSVGTVIDRLKLYGLSCTWSEEVRMLRACLVARHGYGVAFIDGTDDDAEQRFSIAHELAHFLAGLLERKATGFEAVGTCRAGGVRWQTFGDKR